MGVMRASTFLKGHLNVRVPENEGPRWFELKPGDGFFVPEGTSAPVLQYVGRAGVTFLCGIAPRYSPDVPEVFSNGREP